jgi:hypothetical protein
LKIPPEAFLQVPHKRFKPLCVILDPHLGVGSFTGDFVARYNKTYTLFPFTHSKLRHRAQGVHKLEQSPRHGVPHAPTVSTWYRLAFRSA